MNQIVLLNFLNCHLHHVMSLRVTQLLWKHGNMLKNSSHWSPVLNHMTCSNNSFSLVLMVIYIYCLLEPRTRSREIGLDAALHLFLVLWLTCPNVACCRLKSWRSLGLEDLQLMHPH